MKVIVRDNVLLSRGKPDEHRQGGEAAGDFGQYATTWERDGRLTPVARTDSNRRLYTEAQIREFIGLRKAASEPTRLAAYCRVSRAVQKHDLANQRKVREEFVAVKGLATVELVENESLTLKDRKWTCPQCGTHHDRYVSAALNSQRLATATALPMASPSSSGGATAETVSAVAGKVTPVRYECGQHDASGQEKNRAYLRALS